ncbi:LOW QUALITY PROTEIN: uncharacterized protein LOC117790301 [Drosophila innubila]|uniref:LOW QUALITY PROTEIN: uncharacterized protein LOC117790301 n=1 Tax=Drosophila innubila TaxID=198719 RepID=UPI00148B88F9|nr:LOW QUALITY PROTEIN: uncharacterized protein LOC117790301 [Drosophila innubila]
MKLYSFLLGVAVAAVAVAQVIVATHLSLGFHVTVLCCFMLQVTAKFQIRTHDDAVEAHEECRVDNQVPDDIYEKFLNYEFPEHRHTKCYVKCFVEKMGLFADRKGFLENAMITQFTYNNFKNAEKVRHGLEKCIDHNEAESDVCTWAHRVFSCWLPINRQVVRKTLADLTADAHILDKCLHELSTPERIGSDLAKLLRYAEWTSEEVPCLMRCLASEKGWFDIEANKWHKQRLVDELGADIYNYCNYELHRKSRDGCSYAHRGLRCLKQAELHAGNSISTLLQCTSKLNATNVQLLQYSKLSSKESIPCLFQCFADALHFYDEAGNWQLLNWQQAFGPSRQDLQPDYSGCRLSQEQRSLAGNKCAWMYAEYLCWELHNGNLQQQQPQQATN